jgi:hypothetical protein
MMIMAAVAWCIRAVAAFLMPGTLEMAVYSLKQCMFSAAKGYLASKLFMLWENKVI